MRLQTYWLSAGLGGLLTLFVAGCGGGVIDVTEGESPTPILQDQDLDGDTYSPNGGDCDDADASVYPGAEELDDDKDNDCDELIDEGTSTYDDDDDGYTEAQNDCDDGDSEVNPDAAEVPYDDVDQDCDGKDLTDVDQDGADGKAAGGRDCDDEDPTRFPGADEIPYDGIDQDCTGADLTDVDKDGYDATQVKGDDCDDNDANTHPGAAEFKDDKDNDCDGIVDNHLDSYDDDQDGVSEEDGDCDDAHADAHPGGTEVPYDGIDQDCSGTDLADVDGDGQDSVQAGGADCNDGDVSIKTGAAETPYDSVDQDCDGSDLTDVDHDGFDSDAVGGQDCNDNEISIHPDSTETPYDGTDQDCSGSDLTDVDGDGFDSSAVGGPDCQDDDNTLNPDAVDVPYDAIDQDCSGSDLTDVDNDGFSSTRVGGTDCDDDNKAINPGADELCDLIDNNCDSVVDTDAVDRATYYADHDSDGYGNRSDSQLSCTDVEGSVLNGDDCDDGLMGVNPGVKEICNDMDDDCDGAVDDADDSVIGQAEWYADEDQDGFGNPESLTLSCIQPETSVADSTDCDDSDDDINPDAIEICNGVDDDCNAQTDDEDASVIGQSTWYADADDDGFGTSVSQQACFEPAGYASETSDCDDANAAVNTNAQELCDGIDNDCDTQIDDGDSSVTGQSTWYQDADGDGYGTATSVKACLQPSGYASANGDCNDASTSVKPGATEVCDSLDNDCNSAVDDSPSCKISVLVWATGNGSSTSAVAQWLMDSGKFSKVDANTSTNLTLSTLTAYDAVLFYTNSSSGSDPTNGNVLADFADTGKRLVVCTFSWANQGGNTLSGRLIADKMAPFIYASTSLYKSASLGSKDSSSAFMNGISSINGYYRDAVSLVSGATSYAVWSDSYPLLARKNNVVGVNLFPDDSFGQVSGDYKQLFVNALTAP